MTTGRPPWPTDDPQVVCFADSGLYVWVALSFSHTLQVALVVGSDDNGDWCNLSIQDRVFTQEPVTVALPTADGQSFWFSFFFTLLQLHLIKETLTWITAVRWFDSVGSWAEHTQSWWKFLPKPLTVQTALEELGLSQL